MMTAHEPFPTPVQQLTTDEFDGTVYPERANRAGFYNTWDIYEKTMKPFYTGEAEWGKRLEFTNGMVLGFDRQLQVQQSLGEHRQGFQALRVYRRRWRQQPDCAL